MKKRWKMYVFMSLMIMLFGVTNKISVNAKELLTKNLSDGKTYTAYDLTGDQKADQFQYTLEKNSDACTGLSMYINGKKALSIKNAHFYNAYVRVINLKNHKAYVYMYIPGENGDGPIALYQYQNGSLKKVMDYLKEIKPVGFHVSTDVKKVKGNNITFVNKVMSYGLAYCEFTSTYTYKSGKLKNTSTTHTISKYVQCNPKSYKVKRGTPYLTTAYKLTLYSNAAATKKKTSLASGTKVRVTKVYISGKKVRFYVKTSKGKTGWYKAYSGMKKPFVDIMYAG